MTKQSDQRKQSFYFPKDMLEEIRDEAYRLDRTLSYVIQKAWRLAREEMQELPTVEEP